MIHQFKKGDLNFVVDVNSGAIHCVDDMAYDVIARYQTQDKAALVDTLSEKYPKDALEQSYREVTTLVDKKQLFSANHVLDSAKFLNRSFVVKALCLHVAHDCNLRCEYCFAAQGNFHGDNLLMPLEVGKRALDFLVANSGNRRQLEVDLFGGEPTMNWEVCKQLVEYGKALEFEHNKLIRFTITTNGLLLNDEKIDYINRHFHNVVLSIDGRREINDAMRPIAGGTGSYDIIAPKFKQLVAGRGDKSYYVRGTFTNRNIDFDRDVLHLADLGFKETSVEPVVSSPDDLFSLSEADLPAIYDAYDRLADEMVARIGSDKDFRFFHYVIDFNRGPCIIKRVSGCGAGTEYLAVTPQGDIYPCHQFVGNEDFKMGNVMTGEFERLTHVNFADAHVEAKEDCQTCWAKYYCSGGCHANAYNFNKTIDKPYQLGCKMEQKRIENAIYLQAMRQVGGNLQFE